jgi:membrane protein required for colicin V production
MVDNSRSAKVFASFQTNIDDNIPSDAPGWVVARYEALTNVCAPTAEATPAETAPTAPAAGN